MIKESDINRTIQLLDKELCRYRGCKMPSNLVNILSNNLNMFICNIKACEVTPEKEFNDKIDNVINALVKLKN